MASYGGTGAEALKDGIDSIFSKNDLLHLPEDGYKFKGGYMYKWWCYFGKETGLMKRIANERAYG